MNRIIFKIALIGIFTMMCSSVSAQIEPETSKPVTKVIVTMKNGEEYNGEVINKDGEYLVLRTANGEIKLIASNVRSMENYNYDGKFRFPNPNDTRYFFGPSAIPIKKEKGYYQNVYLTTNFVNYGITNNISIGGGFEFISTMSGSPIWFLTPKIGYNISDKVHIGGGFIMAGFAAVGSATLAYGVATLGDSETNVSLGVGYGIVSGGLSSSPSIMISGTHRLTTGLALLTENYFVSGPFNERAYFGIHGIRLLSKKNAFDLGAIVIPVISDFILALPYVGYVRSF
jgi:hypothetical protein